MALTTISFTWPKKSVKTGDVRKKFKAFADAAPTPVTAIQEVQFTPARLQRSHIIALREIHSSTNPLQEAVLTQTMTPEALIGILSSAVLTLGFIKMEAGYQAALRKAKTAEDKRKLADGWKDGVAGFSRAFATAGLPGVDEDQLVAFASELQADKESFDTFVTIANTAEATSGRAVARLERATAGFVSQVGKGQEERFGSMILPLNLCSQPFAQGVFTQHFGQSFSLQVHINLPCITGWHTVWGHPVWPIWGWCSNTYTIAGLSYNVDLQVGYRVTCCGGAAWGYASANVCATVLGNQFCAGCSATIIGAVGLTRIPIATGGCTYGLGLVAELKCTFAGFTVLDVNYPFGYTLQGPCPPPGLC